jgi:MFS transporter, ACDE family, multidrug resistance protein
VLGSFLVGAAVFQIPAGFMALRWGSRRVSLAALAVMGVFALASGFSPNFYVLIALRFGVGAGAAMFFAPALGLVSSYFPAGARGPVIGLYNAGFSVGAAAGLFLGALLGAALGWGWALGLGGVALLLCAGAAAVILPDLEAPKGERTLSVLLAEARPVLRSRRVWALSLAIAGLWGVFFIVAQFFVAYSADVHPTWPLALAAGLPTLMILVEVVGGPLGGLIGERSPDMRIPLTIAGATSCAAVLLIPFLSLAALVPLFVLLGFLQGVVFAVLYLLPSYYAEVRGEGFALALALLNGIQIFAGSALAVAFGYIAADFGYTIAWTFAGVLGLLPLPLMLLVAPTGRSLSARPLAR